MLQPQRVLSIQLNTIVSMVHPRREESKFHTYLYLHRHNASEPQCAGVLHIIPITHHLCIDERNAFTLKDTVNWIVISMLFLNLLSSIASLFFCKVYNAWQHGHYAAFQRITCFISDQKKEKLYSTQRQDYLGWRCEGGIRWVQDWDNKFNNYLYTGTVIITHFTPHAALEVFIR